MLLFYVSFISISSFQEVAEKKENEWISISFSFIASLPLPPRHF